MIKGYSFKGSQYNWGYCHPDIPEGIFKIIKNNVLKERNALSVTSMLSECLFKPKLEHAPNVYIYPEFDNLYYSSFRGSIFHSLLENTEKSLNEYPLELQLSPDITITGTIDSYHVPTRTLWDWKTIINCPSNPLIHHIKQVLVYERMLVTAGFKVDKIAICYFDYSKYKVFGDLLAEKGQQAEVLQGILMNAKLYKSGTARPNPCWLCNGKNRFGKIYCSCKEVCPAWRSSDYSGNED